MRSYWLRILLGAFAVFAIGMLGITMVRRGRNKVEAVFAGAGPLDHPDPVRALPAGRRQARYDRPPRGQPRGPQEGVLDRASGEARRPAGRPGSGRMPVGGQRRVGLHEAAQRQRSREPAEREGLLLLRRQRFGIRRVRLGRAYPGRHHAAAARARIARRAAQAATGRTTTTRRRTRWPNGRSRSRTARRRCGFRCGAGPARRGGRDCALEAGGFAARGRQAPRGLAAQGARSDGGLGEPR